MSMIHFSKNKEIHQPLPNGVTISGDTVTITKNTKLEDTLTIKVHNERVESLHIVFDNFSEAKVILEIIDSLESPANYQVSLENKTGSHVKFLLITEIKSKSSILDFKSSSLNDSEMEFIGGFINDDLNAKLFLDLNGQGASLRVRTIAVSSKDHQQSLDVHMTHYAKNTSAEMTNIGIAGSNGIVKINGVGQIEAGMKGSSAFQTLKGVITNDLAQIDVNPILIIDEFDVKAGHAATVGKIEEDVLYYLMSRGLTLDEAQRLVINGYLRPVIDEIDDELIKENVIKLVNERI